MAVNCASVSCLEVVTSSFGSRHLKSRGGRIPSQCVAGLSPSSQTTACGVGSKLAVGMPTTWTASRLFTQRQHRQRQAPATVLRAHTQTEAAEIDRSACPKVKEQIALGDFENVDIRVGVVTDAKAIPDKEMSEKRGKPTMSRKVLQLKVDIGCETRTVVSECKYVMDVEDAVGKKVLFVANVPPAQVEGIQSHGLILQGLNYDPTPMPRSFKVILPGLGRLPPGSPIIGASIPR